VFCQYALTGKVLDEKTKKPVEYAYITLVEKELWTTSNEKGEFLIQNIAKGKASVSVSCLGYVKKTFELNISGDTTGLVLYLPEDNLLLSEVVITAKSKREEVTTSYIIDRTGLDHLQMLSVTDAMSLLPGGQTNTTLHLATSTPQTIAIRSRSGENGNPSFGTAIEVDGVRLSNNATFSTSGIDTRNIASNNISSLEVITGIPSVEYGDMTNGVVKINTRKGKSPFIVEMATQPNTKQISLNKGFAIGNEAGVLNVSTEYTKSIADLASPYTSYDRKALSFSYANTFNKKNGQPVSLESGITGNIGGYDNHQDPDLFSQAYSKAKDNTFRSHLKANWLLNKTWITNVEASGTVGYTDNLTASNTNKSSSVAIPAIHGKEEGYFAARRYEEDPNAAVSLILPETGYWYQLAYTDSKPLHVTSHLKARWMHTFGEIDNNVLLGTEFSSSGNKGKGDYYEDMSKVTDNWRAYRYDQLPFMKNVAWYVEEKMTIPINESQLQLVAGIRSDNTLIHQSIYGTASSFSPRFNAKYTFWKNKDQFVKKLVFRAGWGKAVKLPSFEVLFPRPYYSDMPAFSDGTDSNGIPFYAYYIRPYATVYTPELQWQYNKQTELGIEMKLKGVYITLSAYDNKMMNAYTTSTNYTPFTYKLTMPLPENFPIARENRIYNIDPKTGIVTISDKTGQHADETLAYKERKTFKSHTTYINGSPSVRRGLEWALDFDKIQALQTSFRIDGNYHYYRGTDETTSAYTPSVNGADGNPYQYVGFYVGGHNAGNGMETKRLSSNLTLTTHIPAIRLIVSLRVEGAFYHASQNLSEYKGEQRGFLLAGKEDYFPSATGGSIYNRNRFTGLYPQYYVSHDDMETQIPFAEALADAYKNNRPLFNELVNLVVKPNTDYYFNESKISGYYSANISITKEISDIASISFYATNFTNNMQVVRSSSNNVHYAIYESGYIPKFYYGLSLRLKL
jgi:hypothetical protein